MTISPTATQAPSTGVPAAFPQPGSTSRNEAEVVWLVAPERAWSILFWALLLYLASIGGRFAWEERIQFFYEAGLLYLIGVGS
ncbi:MAG TPA: hypothetical protein PKO06_02665, partial [Candidatus Ozemobacteraceae bacterium]|nr:hypothetical protein [Candidatus Ozemobacteraceae bacterium]